MSVAVTSLVSLVADLLPVVVDVATRASDSQRAALAADLTELRDRARRLVPLASSIHEAVERRAAELRTTPAAAGETPRRARMDQWSAAERAIYAAAMEVERAGADVRLTDAVNLLQAARAAVADFVEGVRSVTTPGERAFTAYRTQRGGKNHDGTPTPVWADLTDGVREGWEAAAAAARG